MPRGAHAQFADAMTKIYKLWEDEEWLTSSGKHHQLNSHFNPQAGPGSCFKNYKEDVKMYDTISTITDKKKMKQFSAHLPSHKLVRRSCISVATPPPPSSRALQTSTIRDRSAQLTCPRERCAGLVGQPAQQQPRW